MIRQNFDKSNGIEVLGKCPQKKLQELAKLGTPN